jgi:hypothetical protein
VTGLLSFSMAAMGLAGMVAINKTKYEKIAVKK